MAFEDSFDDNFEDLLNENPEFFDVEESTPQQKHLDVLKKSFGHKNFRPLQWKIISSIINSKRDNCAIMTTGYGKSLCFQYPAIYTGGIALVISPLIALMEDQVLGMSVTNISACLLGTANPRQDETISEIFSKKYSLVYLTPEFCDGETGGDMLIKAYEKLPITLIAVDEAHCVSSWGHDFRPSYRRLNRLKLLMPNVPILAVTATATTQVRDDIIKVLNLKNPQISYSGFDRPNFYFTVHYKQKDVYHDLKQYMILDKHTWKFPGPTIIYSITRSSTEEISNILESYDIKSKPYHAGLPLKTRKQVHEDFVKDRLDVIVATIAFGMGIDKPDIRLIIHYGIPSSIESYYQEAGRAGRDGEPAKCAMFYSKKDERSYRRIWNNCGYSLSVVHKREKQLQTVVEYVNTDSCRRNFLLTYFEDKISKISDTSTCCDNCSSRQSNSGEDACIYKGVDENGKYNFTPDIKQMLSAVQQLGGRFGMQKYIAFIRGAKLKFLASYVGKSLYGCGKYKAYNWWKEIGAMCLRKKYLCENSNKFGTNKFASSTFALTEAGKAFINKNEQILETPNPIICKLLDKKDNVWLGKVSCVNLPASKEENIFAKSSKNVHQYSSSASNNTRNINTCSNNILYSKLLEKRAELAEKQDCSRFMIATDAALRQMVTLVPLCLDDFRKNTFDGFTEAKIGKFGTHFIEVIASNRTQRESIKDILKRHPLPLSRKLGSQYGTIHMFLRGRSIKQIADRRRVNESTIYRHLTDGIRAGFPIKLSDLSVTDKIREEVIETAKKLPTGFTVITPIKQNCISQDITYDQINAVKAFYEVREHLNMLGIPYQEFEDFVKEETPEQDRDECVDDLSDLIENLEKANNETEEDLDESIIDSDSTEILDEDDISGACDNLENSINEGQCKSDVCEVFSVGDSDEPNSKRAKLDDMIVILSDEDENDKTSKKSVLSHLSVLDSPPRSSIKSQCGNKAVTCITISESKSDETDIEDYLSLLDSPPLKSNLNKISSLAGHCLSVLDSPPRH